MGAKTTYEHDDYKDLLKVTLLERKATVGSGYTFQAMATACRVQKTYLSRVFNGDAHLNDDQVFLAAEYLGLTAEERRFTQLLHARDRSVVVRKKEGLEREIALVRRRHLMSESHLAAQTVAADAPELASYYLDPDLQLIHMYLTIERYARDASKLRVVLGYTDEELTRALAKLAGLGLIAIRDGRYVVMQPSVHLSPESPVFRPYRKLLRLRALDRADRAQGKSGYSFSVLFSADEATRQRVQARFLDFLKDIEQEVQAAPAEEVYFLGFDLLRW